MKNNRLLLIIIIFLIISIASAIYFFICTNKGSTFIIKTALAKYLQPKSIEIKQSQGDFFHSKVLADLEIQDPKLLPEGSVIRIQKVELSFASLSPQGLSLKIHNGRLKVPGCELIPFQGGLKNNILDFNIYSKSVNIGEISKQFLESKDLKKISGAISGIDIFIRGSLLEPEFEGKCQIEELLSNGFSLSGCPVVFKLRLKDIKDKLKLFGEVYTDAGAASGPKTAVIKLGESKILFSGDPKEAFLNIRGISIVEDTKIEIVLKGRLEQPELKLASEPSLSKERLLLMLATGKSWKASELALSKGELTADSVKDFIDYFVFSGSGSKIAQQLGISDFSVTFEKQKKGLGVKTSVTDKIDATYAVEQTQQDGETAVTTQRLGGEYKITDSLTVGAEKELRAEQTANASQESVPPDDKVFLKFKKEF
jgi:hypothetical protein